MRRGLTTVIVRPITLPLPHARGVLGGTLLELPFTTRWRAQFEYSLVPGPSQEKGGASPGDEATQTYRGMRGGRRRAYAYK